MMFQHKVTTETNCGRENAEKTTFRCDLKLVVCRSRFAVLVKLNVSILDDFLPGCFVHEKTFNH